MKKPNARNRILETAGRLFHERGYSEVGINEIIGKAETAKATFYQHFPSKELLCEAWLESVHERSEVGRSDILHSDQAPAAKIDQYFGELQSYMESSNFRGCPYSNTSAVVEPACTGIVQRVAEHKKSIRQFFCDVAEEVTGGVEEAERLGETLCVLYSGAATEAQNLREIWPVTAARRAAQELCQSATNQT